MKNYSKFFVFLVVLLVPACAGFQQVEITAPINSKTSSPGIMEGDELNLTENQVTTNTERKPIYKSKFFGLPAEDPLRVATAQATVEQGLANAELTRAMAEQIKSGKTASATQGFVGLFINEDPRKTVYVKHPTQSGDIIIPSGDRQFIMATEIPNKITARFDGDRRNRKFRVHKQTGVYDGTKIDFGARLDSQGSTY
ncbi:MAG: hypothetical protein ABH830_02195 [Patescibacteria group bacterium]